VDDHKRPRSFIQLFKHGKSIPHTQTRFYICHGAALNKVYGLSLAAVPVFTTDLHWKAEGRCRAEEDCAPVEPQYW